VRTPMVQKNPSSHTDAALNLATAITKATFKCAAGVEAVGEKQIERHRVDGWAVHARTARGDKPQAVRGGSSKARSPDEVVVVGPLWGELIARVLVSSSERQCKEQQHKRTARIRCSGQSTTSRKFGRI
jgi:hypothetical protein